MKSEKQLRQHLPCPLRFHYSMVITVTIFYKAPQIIRKNIRTSSRGNPCSRLLSSRTLSPTSWNTHLHKCLKLCYLFRGGGGRGQGREGEGGMGWQRWCTRIHRLGGGKAWQQSVWSGPSRSWLSSLTATGTSRMKAQARAKPYGLHE